MRDPPILSQELRLLAACDLADDTALAERIDAATRSDLCWSRLAHLAREHNMAGLVADRLPQLTSDPAPVALARTLGGFIHAGAALQLAQTATAARLSAALEQAGVHTIVLKGMALAHMLYPRLRTGVYRAISTC